MLTTKYIHNSGVSAKPLGRQHQHKKTLDKYSQSTCRLLAALLRGSSGSYNFPTSPELSDALNQLRDCLILQDNNASSSSTHDALYAVFIALWHTHWRTGTGRTSFNDPTVCFIALYSLRESGDFVTPKDITEVFAHISNHLLLLTARRIHKETEDGLFDSQTDACNKYTKFSRVAELTTFATINSMWQYANKLKRSTMSMPRIFWLDTDNYTELLYKGRNLSLNQVQIMISDLQDKLVSRFEQLTSGLLDQEELKWKDLGEDLENQDSGYSFVDEESNNLDSSIKWRQFAEKLMRERQSEWLVKPASGSGAAALNCLKARQWLAHLAEFETWLMANIQFCSGGVPRGTEMVSMLMRNIDTRTRNLYVLGPHMLMVRNYTKRTSVSQEDRNIPNGLDAVVSILLKVLYTYLRPFAAALAAQLEPRNKAAVQGYRDLMFMNMLKEFDSEDLSKAMGRISEPHIGWKLGLNSWRHLQISISGRHGASDGEVLQYIEEDGTVRISQSGHSPTTQRNVYGVSQESMIGASEQYIRMFLKTSAKWATVVRVVPGGLGLGLKEARTSEFDTLVATGVIKSGRVQTPTATPSAGTTTGPHQCTPDLELRQILLSLVRQQSQTAELLKTQHIASLTESRLIAKSISDLRLEVEGLREQVRGNVLRGWTQDGGEWIYLMAQLTLNKFQKTVMVSGFI